MVFQHKVALHNVPHLPLVWDKEAEVLQQKGWGSVGSCICIETFNGFTYKVFFLSLSFFLLRTANFFAYLDQKWPR